VIVYDRLYLAVHRLDTPSSEVGPALRVEIRTARRQRALPDGTILRRGDRFGVMHLNNECVVRLHHEGRSPQAVGLEFRRQLVASLQVLAGLAAPGGRLDDVPAFTATTIFHQGLARFGFLPEPDGVAWPGLVAAYQRALLVALHPPATAPRFRRTVYRRALRLWLSRRALLSRYGPGPTP
jgi:hypothetical protein